MPSVLITGAGRGFGRALFDVYARRGWITFPLVRVGEIAAGLAASAKAECRPIIADVSQDSAGRRIAEVLEAHSGPLDVLINNAGNIRKNRGIEKASPEELEELFRTHCAGVLRCIKAAVPFLSRAERGVVVNISSRWGSITRTVSGKGGGIYSYQIAKCAQNMLTACLDHELRATGIRVFAVHPGRLKTDAAAADADIDPKDAAEALADWVDRVDGRTACGFHDLMRGELIDW